MKTKMKIITENLKDCFHKILEKFDVKTVHWEGEDPCHDPLQVSDLELDAMIIEVQRKLTEYDNGFSYSINFHTESLIQENLSTKLNHKQPELSLYFSDESSLSSIEEFNFESEKEIDFLDIDCSFADIYTDVAESRFCKEIQQFHRTASERNHSLRVRKNKQVPPRTFFVDRIGFFLLLYELNCDRYFLL